MGSIKRDCSLSMLDGQDKGHHFFPIDDLSRVLSDNVMLRIHVLLGFFWNEPLFDRNDVLRVHREVVFVDDATKYSTN